MWNNKVRKTLSIIYFFSHAWEACLWSINNLYSYILINGFFKQDKPLSYFSKAIMAVHRSHQERTSQLHVFLQYKPLHV